MAAAWIFDGAMAGEITDVRITKNYARYSSEYKSPDRVAMLYNYRFTILDFDRNREQKIREWCGENCLRKVEIVVVQTDENQWACICAFEKKTDCVGFKLWW